MIFQFIGKRLLQQVQMFVELDSLKLKSIIYERIVSIHTLKIIIKQIRVLYFLHTVKF